MVLLTAQNDVTPGIGLPARGREAQQLVAQTPIQALPPANDFAQRDWGLAIGICLIAGLNLWKLYGKQQDAESAQTKQLTVYIIRQNQLLLETQAKIVAAVLERKP
jgi:hypothetical protein